MNRKPLVYIVTNSYPEEKVMFSTYEFNSVLNNYNDFKILSFSKFKGDNLNGNVIKLEISEGLKELFFPKKIRNKMVHFRMLKYIKSKNFVEFGKNVHSYLLALSILRMTDVSPKDIFFSYWLTRSSSIAFYLNKLVGNSYLCQGHGSDIYIYPPENIQKILDDSKGIITVANKNKEFLCKKYNLNEEKVKVFRLGVSSNFYNDIVEDKGNLINSDKRHKRRFITIARYETVKGIDLLLSAIKKISEQDIMKNNVEFVIYGDGSKYTEYYDYIKKHNLQKYVLLNRWIDRKKLIVEMNRADCYVLPSRSEGLPVALMEACAASLPIIATDVGSVSEIAIDGYNSILCRDISAEAISEAVLLFMRLDQEKIEEFSRNSNKIFEKDYRLEGNIIEKYDYIKNKLV
ncbi:glycosyltransferase family 4 protein [Bacillus paranthracis]|nr:glycosyltransferase family 4 protein [Bacillus paranthracis]